MRTGDTFYFDTDGSHLFVVVFDDTCSDGDFVVVPVDTLRDGHDESCILNPEEDIHPSITARSGMDYYHAMIIPADKIKTLIELKAIHLKKTVDSSVVDRIRLGAIASERTTPKTKRVIKQNLDID